MIVRLLAVLAGVAATAAPSPAAAADDVVRFHRAGYAYGGESFPDVARDAERYAVWIAQGYHANLLPTLGAAGTGTLPLLYKEALFADRLSHHDATHSHNPGGVTYGKVERDHPDWILRDRNGQPIRSTRYHGYVLMDVGNRAYQRMWAANVIEQARRDGWSGVLADDLALALHGTSAVPRRYASTLRWQAAVRSFLVVVGRELREAGLVLVANVASGVSYPAVRRSWLWTVGGTMEEGWMRPSVSASAPLASAPGDWNRQLQELLDSEARQRLFLAELPASSRDQRAIRYALTTFLLGAGGYSSFGVAGRPEYSRPLWFGDYDRALALGRPLGRARPDARGVWRRAFQYGEVRVNPTKAAHVVTSRRGGPARRLHPQTGVILLDPRRRDEIRRPSSAVDARARLP